MLIEDKNENFACLSNSFIFKALREYIEVELEHVEYNYIDDFFMKFNPVF